jgi:DNA polymerase-3 subunit beta
MRFTATKTDLVDGLQVAAHVASSRSGLAAIGGVLVRAQAGKVTLLATDLEVGVCVPLEAQVEEEGSVLVPARLFLDVVRLAPGGQVACARAGAEENIAISSGQSSVKLRLLRQEDFPTVVDSAPEASVALPKELLATAVAHVGRAASRDETRPLLTGILMSVRDHQLRLVATDSYRLGVSEAPLKEGPAEPFEVTVPARALAELGRLAGQGEEGRVRAGRAGNQVVFDTGDAILSSRLLEGHFPDYKQLLPDGASHELKLNTTELVDVVRRVSLVAQRNAPLALSLKEGELTVAGRTPDVGEAAETLPVDFHGEPFEIGFNPLYLRDGIEAVTSDELVMRLVGPLRPGVIETTGGEAGERFIYLVMPVRLSA